jgi:hypothetical protein
LRLRASHQSIRCRNAGRRLESALDEVLIDKFGGKTRARRPTPNPVGRHARICGKAMKRVLHP